MSLSRKQIEAHIENLKTLFDRDEDQLNVIHLNNSGLKWLSAYCEEKKYNENATYEIIFNGLNDGENNVLINEDAFYIEHGKDIFEIPFSLLDIRLRYRIIF